MGGWVAGGRAGGWVGGACARAFALKRLHFDQV